MKVQKAYRKPRGNHPSACLLKHFQPIKLQKAEPPRCLSLRIKGFDRHDSICIIMYSGGVWPLKLA